LFLVNKWFKDFEVRHRWTKLFMGLPLVRPANYYATLHQMGRFENCDGGGWSIPELTAKGTTITGKRVKQARPGVFSGHDLGIFLMDVRPLFVDHEIPGT
jgi:hypothetical protein